ncbi:hypothetical protein [Lewinella sp. LCG006]|uniref:hypothetical protein n=1 Tax=Lewinella sp. LCG006 TaxID=3231911 RepID=UPI00345FA0FC
MNDQINISVILAILFFIVPIGYNIWNRQEVHLSALIRIVLVSMTLPDLLLCLYYLVTDGAKAVEMREVTQYLTMAVLVIMYLSFQEIKEVFGKRKDTS